MLVDDVVACGVGAEERIPCSGPFEGVVDGPALNAELRPSEPIPTILGIPIFLRFGDLSASLCTASVYSVGSCEEISGAVAAGSASVVVVGSSTWVTPWFVVSVVEGSKVSRDCVVVGSGIEEETDSVGVFVAGGSEIVLRASD